MSGNTFTTTQPPLLQRTFQTPNPCPPTPSASSIASDHSRRSSTTFLQRFWSSRASNDFSSSAETLAVPAPAAKSGSPGAYVPKHAAADCTTPYKRHIFSHTTPYKQQSSPHTAIESVNTDADVDAKQAVLPDSAPLTAVSFTLEERAMGRAALHKDMLQRSIAGELHSQNGETPRERTWGQIIAEYIKPGGHEERGKNSITRARAQQDGNM
ncbi:hypothetical protein BROUX41_000579 [Berkeleyomyces rouxiae]|uniref:uncharacterized protein n=1 Tax=Berkeleyomyces rouxiae TaxID=2035830 RepID=UPI003B7D3F9A